MSSRIAIIYEDKENVEPAAKSGSATAAAAPASRRHTAVPRASFVTSAAPTRRVPLRDVTHLFNGNEEQGQLGIRMRTPSTTVGRSVGIRNSPRTAFSLHLL